LVSEFLINPQGVFFFLLQYLDLIIIVLHHLKCLIQVVLDLLEFLLEPPIFIAHLISFTLHVDLFVVMFTVA
jgi:hypothetical protein